MISPKGPEVEVIARQIANAHTCFNCLNTLWFIPLIPVLVKVVTKIVPGKEMDRLPSEPIYLDYNLLDQTPFAAIHLATKELIRLAQMSFDMIVSSQKAFVGNDIAEAKKVMEMEDNLDTLQGKIVHYLAGMCSSETATNEKQAEIISGLMRVAADIEHIGDQCKNIAQFAETKIKNGYEFSQEAYAEIYSCYDVVKKMARDSIVAIEENDLVAVARVQINEDVLDEKEIKYRMRHMDRLKGKKCSPDFAVIYSDVLHNLERIGDCCNNIADEVLKGQKHTFK